MLPVSFGITSDRAHHGDFGQTPPFGCRSFAFPLWVSVWQASLCRHLAGLHPMGHGSTRVRMARELPRPFARSQESGSVAITIPSFRLRIPSSAEHLRPPLPRYLDRLSRTWKLFAPTRTRQPMGAGIRNRAPGASLANLRGCNATSPAGPSLASTAIGRSLTRGIVRPVPTTPGY
jgi:hypothetical protein